MENALPPGPPLPRAAQTAIWVAAPYPLFRYCSERYGETFTLRLPGAVETTNSIGE